MKYAPIALFVYKRPEKTFEVVNALRANEGAEHSPLFVFSDGPRNDGEAAKVMQVRAIFSGISGFSDLTLRTSETNKGLARSIIEGVNEVLRSHDRVIVLEDDLVTSRYFLRFMNEALEKYRDDDRICCIHAFSAPTRHPEIPYFLRRGADCWGWATWNDRWRIFSPDARRLYDEITARKLAREFDCGGVFPYTKMLKAQAEGKIDSWAIRWYASAFLAEKYTLQSNRMLVRNIGFGQDATHCSGRDNQQITLADHPVIFDREAGPEPDFLRSEHQRFLRSLRPSLLQRALRKLASLAIRHPDGANRRGSEL